jgi:uncharacterized membrane protein
MTIIDPSALSLAGFLRVAILALEGAGIAVIVTGALIASWIFIRHLVAGGFENAYRAFRAALGRTILMGLEFLVAADILKSLVMPHQLENLLGLAVLMVARTFLSLSLNVEINGHWPWHETDLQRAALKAQGEGKC